MSNPIKPRIVIYGVGQYGGQVARYAIEKGWQIVGAVNRAGPKVGQDLGTVLGLDKGLGVIIQDCETADYKAMGANIGIVAQTNVLEINFPAYKELLSAGINVGCHGSESYYPFGCNASIAEQIDALAKENGVTFTGSGIWDMSRIWAGILLLGPCTDINSIFHSSITDAFGQAQDANQAKVIGVGMTLDEFYEAGLDKHPLAHSYNTVPEQVLVAQGHTIRSKHSTVEPVTFAEPHKSPWTGETWAAGTCMGSRIIGTIETEEGVTSRCEVDLRLLQEGEIEHMFWEVDGSPKTRLRTEREDSRMATAACLFNRIPDIINAAPGVVVVSEMGPLMNTSVV